MTPPETELFLRLEQLRRQIDREARRSVWPMIGALCAAFSAGFMLGRLWR
jgi:hypothetical protein